MNRRHSLAITAFALAAVASGATLAQDKGASIKGEKEKCYGVAKAGQNDNAWKYVPKGTCTTMKSPKGSGSLTPVKS
jgi:uncharacterized membrane protein